MQEYHFQIRHNDFSAELAVGGDCSLYALAELIIKAVGFDFDHAFEFCDNLKNPYRSKERYTLFADIGEEADDPGVKKTRLSAVFRPRRKMIFHFDYGDDWSLSVSNNIAEGFERGTTNELLAFLYIARGSAGEVRSMLCFFERRPRLAHFKSQISTLKSLAESCSRQIRGWADSLQNSDIAGPRHLNDQSRTNYQKRKARESGSADFQQLLQQLLPPDHPLRKGKRPI